MTNIAGKNSISDNLQSYLESRTGEVESLLSELITFRSTVGEEHEVQSYFTEYLQRQGFTASLEAVDECIVDDPDYTFVPGHTSYAGRENLIVDIPGSGGGRSLIINSHSDVVPAPDEMFGARCEDGVIYGRGACDAKGQVVTLLLALQAIKDMGIRLKGDLQAQIVIEEEAGGNGALSVLRNGHRADAAVILEPTSLVVHPANRGAVWYKLSVSGKSVHMGKYWDGVNAVKEMMRLVRVLEEYEAFLRRESEGNPLFSFDPSPVNVNIGQISGGNWPATVAGDCTIEGGIAFLPNRRIKQIYDEVTQLIESKASHWAKEHCRFEFSRLHNEAFETPVDHPSVTGFLAAAGSVLGPQVPTGWIASCDARLFYHRGEMPTIVFGPGDLAHAHSLTERIKVEDILRAAEVLAHFIIDWCGVQNQEEKDVS